MTKSHMLAVAVLCASPMLSAQADTSAILSTNNQIGIQYTSTKVDYTETGSGLLGTPTGTLDTETAPFPATQSTCPPCRTGGSAMTT